MKDHVSIYVWDNGEGFQVCDESLEMRGMRGWCFCGIYYSDRMASVDIVDMLKSWCRVRLLTYQEAFERTWRDIDRNYWNLIRLEFFEVPQSWMPFIISEGSIQLFLIVICSLENFSKNKISKTEKITKICFFFLINVKEKLRNAIKLQS